MSFLLRTCCLSALLAAMVIVPCELSAQDRDKPGRKKKDAVVYPVAIQPFQERGREAAELGGQVTDLLFANLVARPDMYLVERENIQALFAEQELNLSGLINPQQATHVGSLTGAKIIVSGSVLVIGDKLYLVAKLIGTETTRVLGASVTGRVDDDLQALTATLADQIVTTVSERSKLLVAETVTQDERIDRIANRLDDEPRPAVWIEIAERHTGPTTLDPAAETELTQLCNKLGFRVIDHTSGTKSDADVVITGEGFSQFAARHGNLISVKARLELKALERGTGRLLAVERQVSVAVDLAEQVAGKAALEDAAGAIAERLLPQCVRPKAAEKASK